MNIYERGCMKSLREKIEKIVLKAVKETTLTHGVFYGDEAITPTQDILSAIREALPKKYKKDKLIEIEYWGMGYNSCLKDITRLLEEKV
jgi:hypothetical protein